MQELLGRLQTLDPQAGAELRIVAHFDTLVAARVGREALLRAAVTLAGCPVGYRDREITIMIDGSGRRHDQDPGGVSRLRLAVPGHPGASVWLDRGGVPLPTDEMIIERLALAIAATDQHRIGSQPLLTLIDPDAADDERRQAASVLRLDGRVRLRMVAVAETDPLPAGVAGVPVADRGDRLLAVLDHDRHQAYQRAGLGTVGGADALATSWRTAVAAFRLAGPLMPVVDADRLGILATLGDDGPRRTHPDSRKLAEAIDTVSWVATTVEALALTGSRRAAAAALGVHHATLQARVDRLNSLLGYDTTTPLGNHRLLVGLITVRSS